MEEYEEEQRKQAREEEKEILKEKHKGQRQTTLQTSPMKVKIRYHSCNSFFNLFSEKIWTKKNLV